MLDDARGDASPTLGIDASEWQPGVDMDAVAAAGMSFVIARACDGDYPDPCFTDHVAAAVAAGLQVAAYWYVRHPDEGTGFRDQAAVVARQLTAVADVAGDLPVWLDCETTPKLSAADVHAAADALAALGVTVAGMYTTRSYWRLRPAPDLGGLWLAQWPGGTEYPGDEHRAWRPFRGRVPDMWQFTDSAVIGGVTVDVSARRRHA